jgi:hypothetical protein
LAILENAIEAGRQLPTGRPLHLNASPAVLADPVPVRALFERANRPIVLEVTEHEVIHDYGAFRDPCGGARAQHPHCRGRCGRRRCEFSPTSLSCIPT